MLTGTGRIIWDVRGDADGSSGPVILFDGVCHLCNGFVQFVLRRDPPGRFAFAPLQSHFSLQRLGRDHLESIALVDKGEVVYAEIAVIRILSQLTPPWRWLARIVSWLPQPILASSYRMVARHRYRLFGRDEFCVLPKPEWKARFLS